jgi:hypothetical protein
MERPDCELLRLDQKGLTNLEAGARETHFRGIEALAQLNSKVESSCAWTN